MSLVNKKRNRRASRLNAAQPNYAMRRWVVLGVMSVALLALVGRAVERQVFEVEFLQSEGERRYLRTKEMPAYRGMITDRFGEPLALSTPVETVWANPQELTADADRLAPLAKALGFSVKRLRQMLAQRSDRHFVYLERRIKPDVAERVRQIVKEQELRGVYLEREYKRFYPAGEVAAHLVGFTDVDDNGQEGLELAYDEWLAGTAGIKRVLKDGSGKIVKDVESIRAPEPGKQLVTSIDRRLQFLAYRELKAATGKHRAKSGSAVILDAKTGEVLAMVNQPAYNPNGSRGGAPGSYRNRAVTDVFEPGSTMKPLAVAAALEAGIIQPGTMIDTAPGYFRVGRNLVRDSKNYGMLDVTTVIQKSSNVGVSKIVLDLQSEAFWEMLVKLGLGEPTASGFPGESAGQLPHYRNWSRFEQATLSFGYGLSATALQLAEIYSVLAADGIKRPVSMHRVDAPPRGVRVMKAETARQVRAMLEKVVSEDGTAPLAAIPFYRAGGKTGTVKKATSDGYADDKYMAVFAGMAPISDPRLVMVVVIDEPRESQYYGGQVAAPVFAKVMAGALRLLSVTPDDLKPKSLRLAGPVGVQ